MTELKDRFLRAERIGWVVFIANVVFSVVNIYPFGVVHLLFAFYTLYRIDQFYDVWQDMIDAGEIE
jgi:hypothetical protein